MKRKLSYPAHTERALANKALSYNSTSKIAVSGAQLKAVYRHGAATATASNLSRDQAGLKAVDIYLEHKRAGVESTPLIASITEEALMVELMGEEFYDSPDHAIFAFAEFSGLGYESIPAFRAAWLRGVQDNEHPFDRARNLAVNLYNCKDRDLLPKER
jgi:hypothetical protein